jgi:hypothetical protein
VELADRSGCSSIRLFEETGNDDERACSLGNSKDSADLLFVRPRIGPAKSFV